MLEYELFDFDARQTSNQETPGAADGVSPRFIARVLDNYLKPSPGENGAAKHEAKAPKNEKKQLM